MKLFRYYAKGILLRKGKQPMTADATLLQMKYARIISLLSKKANIDEEKAMELFYKSNTYMFMSKGISDFHCLSDAYLVEEIMLEQKSI
jgi:hypothetical protein